RRRHTRSKRDWSSDVCSSDLWHSMSWSIHAKAPLAHYDTEDAYGYCDGEDPTIVVPLFKYEGFWALKKVPAGAAVYTTDGLRVLSGEELVEEGVEGPTYPRSVAITQRKAYNSGGGWGSWISDRYGYDLTDKDTEDANAGNTSEFTLIGDDGTMQYVTPLVRSEEHTSELQSRFDLVCRLLL